MDDAAPALSSASVDGDALKLTFNEALDEGSVPPASAFAVTVAGSARTVGSVAVSESAVTLSLSSAVVSGETVTVGYTVPDGCRYAAGEGHRRKCGGHVCQHPGDQRDSRAPRKCR